MAHVSHVTSTEGASFSSLLYCLKLHMHSVTSSMDSGDVCIGEQVNVV